MGTSDDGRVNITDGAKVAAVRRCWTGPRPCGGMVLCFLHLLREKGRG